MTTTRVLLLAAFLATDASAFVVGLGVNQFTNSFDAAGKAFTKELGAHSIRIAFAHGDVDAGVNWAAQNGIGVMYMLGYGKECDARTASGRQCYADRSAGLVRAYGNKVQFWEVWNEWNGMFGPFGDWKANQSPEGTAAYVDLLCRTYRAIKAVKPDAVVVGAVTAGTGINNIASYLDLGAGQCMDSISIHVYPFAADSQFRVPPGSSGAAIASKFVEAVNAVDNLVQQKLGRSMPILATEEGINGSIGAGPEAVQADFLTQIYSRRAEAPALQGIWWFALEDDATGTYGLVRSNNTKKPAFSAFQQAARPVIPPPPVVLDPSPDGGTIPPLSHIVDGEKHIWRVVGGKIYVDGVIDQITSEVVLLLKHSGIIYQRNSFGGWWRWINGAWVGTTDPRAAPPPPVPPPTTDAKMLCEHGADVRHSDAGVIVTCQ